MQPFTLRKGDQTISSNGIPTAPHPPAPLTSGFLFTGTGIGDQQRLLVARFSFGAFQLSWEAPDSGPHETGVADSPSCFQHQP